MRDVTTLSDYSDRDDAFDARDSEHDQVGTVEVQILLSWFFETSAPNEVAVDIPHAA